jgi:hypothetical protein
VRDGQSIGVRDPFNGEWFHGTEMIGALSDANRHLKVNAPAEPA